MKKDPSKILILIIIIGAIVRILGVNFGLPFIYHNDEKIIVNYALAYGAGDLNPHFFKIPPLLSYFLFFLYGIFYIAGKILGIFNSISEFGYLFLNNPTSFFIIGRFFAGVIPGILSIPLIFYLAERAFSRRVAIFASLFLSLNFLHVRDSHYIYCDILLVFFILLFFIWLFKIFEKNRTSDYFVTALIIGIATSIKYNGILLFIPFLLIILRNKAFFKDSNIVLFKRLFGIGLFYPIALFFSNPYMFLDYKFFFNDISRMPFYNPGFFYHLKVSIVGGCGLLIFLFSIGGFTIAIFKKHFFAITLGFFGLIYYFIVARLSQSAERYILPLIPAILLFAAYFLDYIIQKVKAVKAQLILSVLFCIILLTPSLFKIYKSDKLFTMDDTRTQAYEWIKKNIPFNTKIAVDSTGSIYPVLRQSKEFIDINVKNFKKEKFRKPEGSLDYKIELIKNNPYYDNTYRIYYLKKSIGQKGFFLSFPEVELNIDQIKTKGIEYIVVSTLLISNTGKKFLPVLEKNTNLIKEFSPYNKSISKLIPDELTVLPAAAFTYRELKDRDRFGPVIRIYKFK
ncbi:MAG: glycosyltransferase family 39 protein [Patescibacteria group bacterium]